MAEQSTEGQLWERKVAAAQERMRARNPKNADKEVCEAKRWSEGGFPWPCDMPAKWLVEMEGRAPIKVCGRHLRSFKGEISVGWRGKIMSLISGDP